MCFWRLLPARAVMRHTKTRPVQCTYVEPNHAVALELPAVIAYCVIRAEAAKILHCVR